MAVENIDYAGYQKCIALRNDHARIVLGPHCGGRVLEYAWEGQNALMLDPRHDGWEAAPGREPLGMLFPSGGRFDIGPEHIIPKHPELWYSAWQAEIVDNHTVRMSSVDSPTVGVRLIREFSLAADGSHLRCTQTQVNISDHATRWCHWSRTFGRGHGICIVPLTPELSRFPRQYVMYEPRSLINFEPQDAAILVKDGFLLVLDTPQYPKLGIDSYAGWFGYLMPQGLLFLKRFPTDPTRVYNEMAGLTLSLWYYKDLVCELEPIGPMEVLEPGESASFTEDWWLLPHPFPAQREALGLSNVVRVVEEALSSSAGG